MAELAGNIEVKDSSLTQNRKGLMALQLSNLNAREWIQKQRETIQPWSEFLSTSRFKVPRNLNPTGKRVVKNLEKFQGNYLFVFIGLVIFCIITSPFLLVALATSLGACYIISIKNREQPLKLLGREVTVVQQYTAVGVVSVPLFWLAGAGTAVFWIIGASVFFILLHATFFQTQQEIEDQELEMETV